jgi:Raf kinase inhibitor-like YbhB/YbcL family protein
MGVRKSYFAGLVADPVMLVASLLLFFTHGCSDGPTQSDLTASGGVGSTGAGGDPGSGGVATGGNIGAGGDPGSGGVATGGTTGGGGDSGSGGAATGGLSGDGGGTAFVLTSPAFEDVEACSADTPAACEVFPDENVSYEDRPNLSPELHWTGVPSGTQSFALVLFDVTYGQAHWVLWNIPADVVMLATDVPQDAKMPATPAGSEQANANFATTSEDGYFGPHMPCNVFEFQLFALGVPTFTPENADSAVLVHAQLQNLDPPALGLTRLTGRANDYDMTCE